MKQLFLVIISFLSLCSCDNIIQQQHHKNIERSYICPPKFIRQGQRCYFFSKDAVAFQEALFQCRNMRSNLAVIRKSNQDKLIRNFLNKNTLAPLERWLGAVYDWNGAVWKWAASAKPLTYNGFDRTTKEDKDSLWWHCAIMDPALQYRWSSRLCVEKKHFICQTKIKTVTNKKDKKKLAKQYNANKYNKLNEILVPTLPVYNADKNSTTFKSNDPVNYRLSDQALGVVLPRNKLKRFKKNKKNKARKQQHNNKQINARLLHDEIMSEENVGNIKRKRKKHLKTDKNLLGTMQWTTYRKSMNLSNPFYPRPIVMEYSFSKDS